MDLDYHDDLTKIQILWRSEPLKLSASIVELGLEDHAIGGEAFGVTELFANATGVLAWCRCRPPDMPGLPVCRLEAVEPGAMKHVATPHVMSSSD